MFDRPVVEKPRGGFGDGRVDEAAWDTLLAPTSSFEGQAPDPEPGFADCAPSGWLALELDDGTAAPARLSDESVVEAIVGFDRVASWALARQARLLAELTRRRPADPVPNADGVSVGGRFVPDEVGVALKLARGTAVGRVGTACRLLSVLPATHALWEAGRIDAAKARAIDEATTVLPDDLARAVQERVLPRAPEQSLAQLRASLARAVIAVDPDGAAERHTKARRDRRVSVQPEADGMGSLWALLTASDAAGAYQWLTRLARGLGKDDPRTMDERRADLLAELLNGRLVPDVETIDHNPDGAALDGAALDGAALDGAAPSGEPGEERVAGGAAAQPGAMDAAADSSRRRVRVRPVTPGKPLIQVVISHSTLTGADDAPAELVGHGPIPAGLAREIAADGVWHRLITDPLSGTVHHHKLKHHAGWTVEAHPDGRLTWTTPTGHRHTTTPHDYGPEPPRTSPPATTARPDRPTAVEEHDPYPDPPPF